MTRLLLGPLLRHVGSTDATVWVETDGPCEVAILGFREHTWMVAGHHYALVGIEGLPTGESTPYDVRLDGDIVWPQPDATMPASRIRTFALDQPVQIAFGSCRYASAAAVLPDDRYDADVLDCYASKIADLPEDEWPEALVMLGDQVYADETSPQTQQRIRERRDITTGSKEQVADFEEYTWLYSESWTDPQVRWLLSTVPSSMIFDDHDVRDDWNTSQSWRLDMQAKSWWQERIIGALSSYWVYQHLGNLSPNELAENKLYQDVRSAGDDVDVEPLLREYAEAADREADGAKGARWSYRRDFGSVRLLVIDSRCGRILDKGERSMLSEAEFSWIEEQLAGDYDHLLIGTSLPWLLPRAFHDIEAWNELLSDGRRGKLVANVSEKIRRAGDFEHWAAFRKSFERLALMIKNVASGTHAGSGSAPATVCVLSGDVHHAYIARPEFDGVQSAVFQLTCSPLHNRVPPPVRLAFRAAWSRAAERSTRVLLGTIARVPKPIVEWTRLAGPYFGNDLMTLTLSGRHAELLLEQAGPANEQPQLTELTRLTLA